MTFGKSQIPYTAFAKWIGRWDSSERVLRLFRIVWRRGEGPGFGKGYCAKFSVAVAPRLFQYEPQAMKSWLLTLCGIRVHYQRSYGGWIV